MILGTTNIETIFEYDARRSRKRALKIAGKPHPLGVEREGKLLREEEVTSH